MRKERDMKWPVARFTLAWVMFVGLLLGGCAPSVASAARNTFVLKYSCPGDQVTVGPAVDAPGGALVDANGCGYDAKYGCITAMNVEGQLVVSCNERMRVSYEATDGSLHKTLDDVLSGVPTDFEAVSKEAAIASAAHDLPCDPASVVAVGKTNTLLEGCGQRVTYQLVGYDIAPPAGHVPQEKGRRYTLVGRIPIPTASSSVTAPPPAPGPTSP